MIAQNGTIKPFVMPRGYPTITHLAFTDDIMIFARRDRRKIRNLMVFLELYQTASGQRVNKSKSFFVACKRCGRAHIQIIEQLTGMHQVSFLLMYLG